MTKRTMLNKTLYNKLIEQNESTNNQGLT